ncbi:hypothetical protein PINS_up013050 [Pythium insidiosum]|nr:hypothetical protein PINS_up013050 [Pythium insidiosum]
MSSPPRKRQRQRRRATHEEHDELTRHPPAPSPRDPQLPRPSPSPSLSRSHPPCRVAPLLPPPDSSDLDASTLQRSRALVGVAQHYFELFRHGFIAHDDAPLRFLEARTDPTASLQLGVIPPTGSSNSVEFLLAQWRQYTELFAICANELRQTALVLQQPEQTVVRCRLTFHGRLTAAALQQVFPLAWLDHRLRARVLDRRVACDMVFHLFFDGGGRLVRHDAEADFLSTMLDAFGDVATAAAVVADARLGPEATIDSGAQWHPKQRQQQQQQRRRRRPQRLLVVEEGNVERGGEGGATSSESTPATSEAPSPQQHATTPPPKKMELAFVLS